MTESVHGMHYVESGSGRPLLLLHGFGENTYSWRFLLPVIPSGYKIYSIDLKGFGKSAKPLDHAYALADHAELVCDIVRSNNLGEVSLVGHSMGGGVALLIALKLMDDGTKVSSLTLIDTIAYPQRVPAFVSLLRMPVLNWIAVSMVPAEFQVRTILKLAYYDDRKITDDAVRQYAAPLKQPGGRHALIETAKQMIPGNIEEITRRYSTLEMPTLIVWGKNDQIVPMHVGEQLHSAIKNSILHVVNACGHIPHEEVPDECVNVIGAFLEKHR